MGVIGKFKKDQENLQKTMFLKKYSNLPPPFNSKVFAGNLSRFCSDRQNVIVTHGMRYDFQNYFAQIRDKIQNPEVLKLIPIEDNECREFDVKDNLLDIGEEEQKAFSKYVKRQIETIFLHVRNVELMRYTYYMAMTLKIPPRLGRRWLP